MGERITITTADGSFGAYLARPSQPRAPSVVVLHEVFGVNSDIRETCDTLASKGFIAVAPDLFWRQEFAVDLDVTSEADWNHGLALYTGFDRAKGVPDIIETVKVARQLDGASGKAGMLGYCLGGLMTYLTAARSDIDAAVWFHGSDTEKYLDEALAITAPFLMHFAGADEFIPPAAQAAIKAALADHGNVQTFDYPGRHHAFTRHGGAHYSAQDAQVANARTWAFLQAHLG
jgi:carboxymethylenebutenolidase